MKKKFKIHQEWVLGFLAAVLSVFLIMLTIWTIGVLAVNLEKSIVTKEETIQTVMFNLEGVKKLNLPGLQK